MKFAPRPYQLLIAEHILNHPRCAVWAGMGMGKTSATLFALDVLRLIDDNPTLIIAPSRVATGVWPAEAAKWEDFHGLKVVAIAGSAEARRGALKVAADIHTINYDNLQWLLAEVGVEEWPWKTVVADESTRLKSFRLGGHGGQRARALSKVAFSKVERFIELTGTPSPNGLLDLWGQLWFLDKGARLGRTFTAFTDRWFKPPHPMSYDLAPMPHSGPEITAKVSDVCLSVRAQDYFDVKEPIIMDVPVTLPSYARKDYTEMEKKMFIELESGGTVEATMAATKTIKCLQIANGAVYLDAEKNGRNYDEIHDAKLEALDEVIEEAAGMPILVAYHFKTDLIRLKSRYPYGRELDKDAATLRDWNAGKIPIMFAHPASAGHGLNLQDGGNIDDVAL